MASHAFPTFLFKKGGGGGGGGGGSWGCISVVKYLPSMYKTLGLIPSTTKKLKKKKRGGESPYAYLSADHPSVDTPILQQGSL
jgi:hypothetical protein